MQYNYVGYLSINNRIDYSTKCEVIEVPLWWQSKGLQYTATGYGSKIPTKYKMRLNKKLYRVYCSVFSNIGTLYILKNKQKIIVDIGIEKL